MPLVWCGAIYAAIVLPWFILMEARNPGFMRFFFIHEHLERYITSSEHGWGPWFFIPIVIGGMWPWIFFVPLGWSAMRAADASESDRAPASSPRSAASFLAIWFVVVFVFFSIPRSKLGSYILPALPPLAIVAGYGLAQLRALDDASRRRLFAVIAIANLVLVAAVSSYFSNSCAPSINPALGFDGLLIGGVLAAGAIAMYALGRTASRLPYAIGALALAMLVTVPLAARLRETRLRFPRIATWREPFSPISPATARSPRIATTSSRCRSIRTIARLGSSIGASCPKFRRRQPASRHISSVPKRGCARSGRRARAWFSSRMLAI